MIVSKKPANIDTEIFQDFLKARQIDSPGGVMVTRSELQGLFTKAQSCFKKLGVKDGRVTLHMVNLIEDRWESLKNSPLPPRDLPLIMAEPAAVTYWNKTVQPKLDASRLRCQKTLDELMPPKN